MCENRAQKRAKPRAVLESEASEGVKQVYEDIKNRGRMRTLGTLFNRNGIRIVPEE